MPRRRRQRVPTALDLYQMSLQTEITNHRSTARVTRGDVTIKLVVVNHKPYEQEGNMYFLYPYSRYKIILTSHSSHDLFVSLRVNHGRSATYTELMANDSIEINADNFVFVSGIVTLDFSFLLDSGSHLDETLTLKLNPNYGDSFYYAAAMAA